MTDTFTLEKRSAVMRAIKSKDTKPEMLVRRLVHSMGYRYRLHKPGLVGKPDLVFALRKKIVFVHGCFWHGHIGCRSGHLPKSNQSYWNEKISRNKERDLRTIHLLKELGWEVLVVWECETRSLDELRTRLEKFLGAKSISNKAGPNRERQTAKQDA